MAQIMKVDMWGYGAGMSFRLAAYAVCIEDGRVLLARYVSPEGGSWWTLPGGGVEHGEDPFDAVIRELGEETGCDAVVERLLGVDSRVIPAAERHVGGYWQVVIWAQEFFRGDPLGVELRERVVSALESVDGVTRVTEHDNESWDAWGAPSGEALTRAAANAVDDLAGRLREAMGIA